MITSTAASSESNRGGDLPGPPAAIGYNGRNQETMNRYLFYAAVAAVVIIVIVLTMYRRARRGPPGSNR